jgi:uncharacterized protein (TIGR02246 family)
MLGVAGALLAITGCARVDHPVDPAAEKPRVKAVVDQFQQVWETEDTTLFAKIMAHDADMVNFGSDASEHFVGWDALRDAVGGTFPALDSTKLVVSEQVIHVDPDGRTAWFSEMIDWNLRMNGQPVQMKGCRFTGVLEKRDGDWVIVQFHNSMPMSG